MSLQIVPESLVLISQALRDLKSTQLAFFFMNSAGICHFNFKSYLKLEGDSEGKWFFLLTVSLALCFPLMALWTSEARVWPPTYLRIWGSQ